MASKWLNHAKPKQKGGTYDIDENATASPGDLMDLIFALSRCDRWVLWHSPRWSLQSLQVKMSTGNMNESRPNMNSQVAFGPRLVCSFAFCVVRPCLDKIGELNGRLEKQKP